MASAILFLLFSMFLMARSQQTISKISLGSVLSPTGNSSWLSPSGLFAFGFFPKGNGSAIGIWFAGNLQKTVIWTANRDDPPIPSNVSLVLTRSGQLVLQQVQGQEISIANASTPASFASVLDSGNFILYDANSRIIWQSFDYPTDTLMQGQHLRVREELFSSISETNPSTGSYRLIMQHDANLVLYPVNTQNGPDYAYWSAGINEHGDNFTLMLDPGGHMYLINSAGVNYKDITNIGMPSDGKIYRLTIDADGILRLYSHNLDQNGNWSIEWKEPNDRCDPKGICGINSYCVLLDLQPVCTCPPGFVPIDQEQKIWRCGRNFSAEECSLKNKNMRYVIYELENTVWVNRAYSSIPSMTKEECRQACLGDCNCEAALFQDQECRKQKLPLTYGKRNPDENSVALVKVGIGGLVTRNDSSTEASKECKNKLQIGILTTGITCLTFAFIVLAVAAVLIFRCRNCASEEISSQANRGLVEDFTLRSFTYEELQRATNNFTEKLGMGAFGTVFKGTLSNGHREIAVKRLEKVVTEGEVEFQNEMRSIGRAHHRNLVHLLGSCHDSSHILLVYEYMSNGSLADFLFKSETKPSWGERIGIALNIANGILYLHEGCESQIIHCDINPNNILMDERHCAKISDFGLAKLLMPDQSRTLTEVRGTRGYVAPEWYKRRPVTVKADVYSFGIVFLEIICCRRSVSYDVPENEAVLADWVYSCFEENEVRKLVSAEEVDEQTLQRMVSIGIWCIQDEPSVRPSMKTVVLMLEGAVEIPVPPMPASFGSIV